MRLHLLGLPHTQTNKHFPNNVCAYTQKAVNLAAMLETLKHEVYLYGGPEDANTAPCTEYIECISACDQKMWFDPPYPEAVPPFRADEPGFAIFNTAAAREINHRKQEGDLILQFGGTAQQPVTEYTDLTTVEAGIGYSGVFSDYKVFESYAWMHTVYGMMNGLNGNVPDGWPLDTVIPNSYNVEDFPEGKGDGGYVLFIGRIIERKGVHIAAEAAKRAGKRLIIAGGQGNTQPAYGEMVGQVGPEERAALMGGAEAVLIPTVYTEPFGGVAVEAMLCGTPVLTTDWGAFTETVVNRHNGWRCRTMGEFVWGLNHVKDLDRGAVRRHAVKRYSIDVVKDQYQEYLERVVTESEERRPGR